MDWLTLIQQARQGDKQSRDTIIEENMGLVHHIVKRFLNRGYDAEELFQIGCIGLMKAVDHFDTGYDVKFSTYAVPMIMGEIKRFLRDNGMIKVSRSLKENAWRIRQTRTMLEAKLGREPAVDEIATQMELSVEEIIQAMEADVEVESLSRTVYQGDGNEICLYEKLADERDDMQQLVNHVFLQDLLQKLPEEEQELIRYRYYDNLTQVETAKRMGISQVQVSRLEKKHWESCGAGQVCRFHDGNKIVEFRLKSKTGQFAHKNIQKTGQK